MAFQQEAHSKAPNWRESCAVVLQSILNAGRTTHMLNASKLAGGGAITGYCFDFCAHDSFRQKVFSISFNRLAGLWYASFHGILVHGAGKKSPADFLKNSRSCADRTP